ncbi:MAG: hydroxyacylglutathione hydrolase [Salaquimonas sp.]
MSKLELYQFPYLSDNYGFILHDATTGKTAAIDCGDAESYLQALDAKGWNLTEIWITHHHWDHVQGLMDVKAKTGCRVRGPKQKSTAIEGLDEYFWDGDTFEFAGRRVQVISTPGHTTDMINYYLPSENILFSGDTLFTLGCGRIFEGTPQMMWESMERLLRLPVSTLIYGSHEYTLANAKFALSVDPENEMLEARAVEVEEMRKEGTPTVPTTLELELATNPFLRAGDKVIREHLGMANASDAEVFAEIRKRKDNF